MSDIKFQDSDDVWSDIGLRSGPLTRKEKLAFGLLFLAIAVFVAIVLALQQL